MSKKSERRKKYEAMLKKQLDEAYKFPFCRRCKEELPEKWCVELKKKKMIPLCKKCLEPMLEAYKRNIEKWQKFRR